MPANEGLDGWVDHILLAAAAENAGVDCAFGIQVLFVCGWHAAVHVKFRLGLPGTRKFL